MFLANILLTVVWLGWGPFVNWSDRWQLWANTTTTIVTYLMVFVVQHSQNKSDAATHAKLDELIKRIEGPRDEMAGLDLRTEDEIKQAREE